MRLDAYLLKFFLISGGVALAGLGNFSILEVPVEIEEEVLVIERPLKKLKVRRVPASAPEIEKSLLEVPQSLSEETPATDDSPRVEANSASSVGPYQTGVAAFYPATHPSGKSLSTKKAPSAPGPDASSRGSVTLCCGDRELQREISPLSPPAAVRLNKSSTGVLSLSPVPAFVRGNEVIPLSYQGPVASTALVLELSLDGGVTYTEVSVLSLPSGVTNWTAPAVDISRAILRLRTNFEGKELVTLSQEFVIDSTSPGAPVATLTSPAVSNQSRVTFNLGSCSDVDAVFVATSAIPPAKTDPGWLGCELSLQAEISPVEGLVDVFVFAKDLAGNVSPASLPMNFQYDITPPSAAGLLLVEDSVVKLRTINFSQGDCAETPLVLFSSSSTTPSAAHPGWQSCFSLPVGMSYELPNLQVTHTIYGFTKDPAGNVSSAKPFAVTLDSVAPDLESVVINPSLANPSIGDEYTSTNFVNVYMKFFEVNSGASYALLEADTGSGVCALSTPVWTPVGGQGNVEITRGFQISSGDGVKKICAWIRDRAGNISAVGMNTIKLEIGNPPKVNSLVVENAADGSQQTGPGSLVRIIWDIEDVEGLSNNPISFEYTTDNTVWLPLRDTLNQPLTAIGGLNGYPKLFSGQISVPAPSVNFFLIRMLVQDKAGNDSIPSYGPTFNTIPWKVYAGTSDTGIGFSAKATLLYGNANYSPVAFAFDPASGDLYVNERSGIIKIDIRTGKSSLFLKYSASTNNLPASGHLTSAHSAKSYASFVISSDGHMFLSSFSSSTSSSGHVHKINLKTKEIELFIGTGVDYTALNDPMNLNWVWSTIAIDSEDSLYGLLLCSNLTEYAVETSAYKLVKITKNKVITHIAGNCARGNPFVAGNGPLDPLSHPLGEISYPGITDFAIGPDGKTIVFSTYNSKVLHKIINGVLFKSSYVLPGTSRYGFSPEGRFYVFSGQIKEVNLSVSDGNDSEVSTVLGNNYALPNCQEDGKLVSQSCGLSYFRPGFSRSGQLMFADGPIINGPRPMRIRYINSEGRVVTFGGTKIIHGQGLDKSVFRGTLSSIDYQNTGNGDFPAGLYFASRDAVSVYYINPLTHVLGRSLGNEIGLGGSSLDNQVINHETNLGEVYASGAAGGLFRFNEHGYPYMKIRSREIYKIGPGKIGTALMYGTKYWDDLIPGVDKPSAGHTNVFAGVHNLTLKGDGLFFLGVGGSFSNGTTTGNNSSSLRFMDFLGEQVIHIMGGNGTNAHTDDVLVAGDLRTLHLNTKYNESAMNFTEYDKDTDRLYFVEAQKRLRYITAPGTHSSKLVTLLDFSATSGNLGNFTIRPDGSSIFYVKSGRIYCYNLGTAPDDCDNTTDLGPASGLPSLPKLPNQFTWKGNDTLFATDGNIIMTFDVPF